MMALVLFLLLAGLLFGFIGFHTQDDFYYCVALVLTVTVLLLALGNLLGRADMCETFGEVAGLEATVYNNNCYIETDNGQLIPLEVFFEGGQ